MSKGIYTYRQAIVTEATSELGKKKLEKCLFDSVDVLRALLPRVS